MRKKPLNISWRSWCLYKLAKRDYAAAEMKKAIQKRAASSDQEVDPNPIVDQLLSEGILDDERYVKNKIRFYTESTFRRGPVKLRDELLKKAGISADLLDRYLDDADPKWTLAAEKNCQKILQEKGLNAETPQSISDKIFFKIKRSLYSKGFTSSQINRAMTGLSPIQERKPPKPPGDVHKMVEARMASGKGAFEIRQFLLQKGVAKNEIEEALALPDEVWIEIAVRARQKRFGESKPKTMKEKKRQTDFLQRRGFSFGQINAALAVDG